jgi:transmembrane sensor
MDKNTGDRKNIGKLIWLSDLFKRYYEQKATKNEITTLDEWDPEKEGKPHLRFFKKDRHTEKMWNEIAAELGFATRKKSVWLSGRMLQKYAAAAMVLLFISVGSYFYFERDAFESTREVVMKRDYFLTERAQKQLTLPDGTVVTMNSDTKLGIVTASYNEDKREVWLEEGEAFFEVAKDPTKPFIVHSKNLETTVKGTSFNVKAYKELDQNSVSVRSGKVEVRNEGNLIGELIRDDQVTYNSTTRKIEKNKADWHDAAAWMDHRLVMKRADIKELKLRLRQQFNVELVTKNNVLEGTLLNSSFEKGTRLKQVLEVISAVYDVKYDLSQKGKVIIYK